MTSGPVDPRGPGSRPDPVETARAVVETHHPDARQAWLSGSVVLGGAGPTSDLDVTVLLDAGDSGGSADAVVHRRSLTHDGWPVELFVHTEASVRHFVELDRRRRRPTMARLVATGVPLLGGDAGAALQAECADLVVAGPGPLADDERDRARYALTDLLDDLVDVAVSGGDRDRRGGAAGHAVAVEVWRQAAELLLAAAGRWSGTGKWLVREVDEYDAAYGSAYAERLDQGLQAALSGDPNPLAAVAEEVLDGVGGRLWAGYSAVATVEEPDAGS